MPVPNRVSALLAELKACSSSRNLQRGKSIHQAAIKNGDDRDPYVASTLINMYAKCGSMDKALAVFEKLQDRGIVSWNALILGYADNGEGNAALDLLSRMRSQGCAADARTFVFSLKACTHLAFEETFTRGKALHLLASISDCDSDAFVANTLIGMYAKAGSMDSALGVFEMLKYHDDISWTALIMGYASNGKGGMALDLFSSMRWNGCEPNARSFVGAVKACSELVSTEGSIKRGKLVHLLAAKSGCDMDPFVVNTLIDFYAKCGRMCDARSVFESATCRSIVSWTALLVGYVDAGEAYTALDLFSRMRNEGCESDARAFTAAIRACTDLAEDEERFQEWGRVLHLLASSSGCDLGIYVQSTLVDMYAKFGSMEHARLIFDEMNSHDVVTWTALILGYANEGKGEIALNLFANATCVLDARIFVAAAKACAVAAEIIPGKGPERMGRALHLLTCRNGYDAQLFVGNTLLDMFAKCGSTREARRVFEKMRKNDVVSWNALILGYVDAGEGQMALETFSEMRIQSCEPDSRTFVAAMKACGDLAESRRLPKEECRMVGSALYLLASIWGCGADTFVQSILVDMYSKCGTMQYARFVFEAMEGRTASSWTALIMGYADIGEGETCLRLFARMREEGCSAEDRTFVAVLKACIDLAAKEEGNVKERSRSLGKAVQVMASSVGCDADIFVGNTLVDLYAKCGCMDDARTVFEKIMKYRDVVTWTAYILGYADNGEGKVALDLFLRMKREGFTPDARAFVGALKACGMLGALETGRALHSEIRSCGFERDPILVTCLVDFYAKCGSLVQAKHLFDEHAATRDLIAWNALMAGFGRNGDMNSVFDLFERMLRTDIQPDGVSFLCVLAACSHAGLLEKGKAYFEIMATKFGVPRTHEHYNCMLDILGRANKLDDGMELLRSVPFSPNQQLWMAVLGACDKWKHVELGKLAFESFTSLNDQNAAAYILMSNIGSVETCDKSSSLATHNGE